MPPTSRLRSALILATCFTVAAAAAPRDLPKTIGSPFEKRAGNARPGQGAGTFLSSGETVTFRLPVVGGPAVFTGGFRVEAPPGARSIRIEIDSPTPGADLDLFVRFGQDVSPVPDADYQSQTVGTSTEAIVIDGTSAPPLQTGFYFIAFSLDATPIPVIGRITATVDVDTPPQVGQALTSGVPAAIAIPAVGIPAIAGGDLGFRIEAPPGAQQLRIVVQLDDPNAQIQIFARQGFDVQVFEGRTFTDWTSGPSGNTAVLTITSASPPQLIPGTIFIALGLRSVGTPFMGTITATVTVDANPPAIGLSEAFLEFNSVVGQDPDEQEFTVQNVGGGRLLFILTADQPWVILRPNNGRSDGEEKVIRVDVDVAGVPAGEHEAVVTVAAEDGSDQRSVTVRLLLAEPGIPQIELSESALAFDLAPDDLAIQTVSIRNSGGGLLLYRIESNVPWMEPNIFNGASVGEADPFTLRIDTQGLEPGFYDGEIRIRSDDANLTSILLVQLRVRGDQAAVFATTLELMFEAAEGGPSPSPEMFSLANSGPGELNYQITSDQPWLAVSPSMGVLGPTLQSFRAAADTTGLEAGSHEGMIHVAATAVAGVSRAQQVAPLVIRVIVTVQAGVPLPFVSENAVLNAASFVRVGIEGHAVAPGSIVSIFGTDFANDIVVAQALPLPLAMGGISVRFDGLPAPLFAVTPTQINAQLPSGLVGTEAVVTVTGPGGTSVPRTVQILPYSPAIFSLSQQGFGQGIVTYAGPPENFGQLVAPSGLPGGSRAGRSGDVITIWVNGLGPVDPPVQDGRNSFDPGGFRLRNATMRPTVRIGGVVVPDVNILFTGLAPEFVGVFQVNLILPQGLPSGAALSLVIEIGGVNSRDDITIALE